MLHLSPVTVRVRDAMENKVVFFDASKTVADAAKTMMEKAVWSFVVTRGGMPVGVLTERDMIRRCYAKGLNPEMVMVESVMSSPIVTIEPEAQLGQAMILMAEKDIRRVYVVESGEIIGRITQTGVFGNMLDIMMAMSAVM